MNIPFDEHLGVHPQDAHFLEREMWDLANTPMTKRPLLLHYHPLVIYRFQVIKQADVVLALFLQGEDFTLEQKKADFDYYDPITTGDSTLSAVVQSIIAAEVGYHDLALRYFLAALFVDLADRHGNTADGVHVASTGGVWNAMAAGFGGFRDHGAGQWSIDPAAARPLGVPGLQADPARQPGAGHDHPGAGVPRDRGRREAGDVHRAGRDRDGHAGRRRRRTPAGPRSPPGRRTGEPDRHGPWRRDDHLRDRALRRLTPRLTPATDPGRPRAQTVRTATPRIGMLG